MLIRHYVRRFASTAARAAAADAVHQPFSAAVVCSPDNRTRCIQRLQRTPTLRLSTPDLNRTSAVLVPLCTDADGRLSVLYTLRSASLNAHSRQVSFAGGKRDPTDVSYVACALREAAEEIGLRADQIDIWGEGQLLQSLRPPSIMPVIGYVHDYRPDELRLSADEVAEVFTVPLETLCAPANCVHTQFRGRNETAAGYTGPVFLGGAHRIWGITAMLTHMFLLSLLPATVYGRRRIPFVPKRPAK